MKITQMYRDCILLNDVAYVAASSTAMELLELERELNSIDSEYKSVFEFNALFKFYRNFGMHASIVSILSQLSVGNDAVISVGNSNMRITRVSKHFCIGEWLNVQHNYNHHQVNRKTIRFQNTSRSTQNCEEYEEQQLLCNWFKRELTLSVWALKHRYKSKKDLQLSKFSKGMVKCLPYFILLNGSKLKMVSFIQKIFMES